MLSVVRLIIGLKSWYGLCSKFKIPLNITYIVVGVRVCVSCPILIIYCCLLLILCLPGITYRFQTHGQHPAVIYLVKSSSKYKSFRHPVITNRYVSLTSSYLTCNHYVCICIIIRVIKFYSRHLLPITLKFFYGTNNYASFTYVKSSWMKHGKT